MGHWQEQPLNKHQGTLHQKITYTPCVGTGKSKRLKEQKSVQKISTRIAQNNFLVKNTMRQVQRTVADGCAIGAAAGGSFPGASALPILLLFLLQWWQALNAMTVGASFMPLEWRLCRVQPTRDTALSMRWTATTPAKSRTAHQPSARHLPAVLRCQVHRGQQA